jgi:hypothetical protein
VSQQLLQISANFCEFQTARGKSMRHDCDKRRCRRVVVNPAFRDADHSHDVSPNTTLLSGANWAKFWATHLAPPVGPGDPTFGSTACLICIEWELPSAPVAVQLAEHVRARAIGLYTSISRPLRSDPVIWQLNVGTCASAGNETRLSAAAMYTIFIEALLSAK